MPIPGVYTDGITPSNILYPSDTLYPLSDTVTIIPNTASLDVFSATSIYWFAQEPSYTSYLNYLNQNVRATYFKIELLRVVDESVYDTIISDVINGDGNVNISLQEGVRRTCSLSLTNALREYTTFFSNVGMGNKFKLYLGYLINNKIKWFPQGVFAFDNPALISNRSNRYISLSGTDKWSFLNGQNGGVLNATYIAPMGSTVIELIRSILALNIVSDPIEPLIHTDVSFKTITYDITKQAGETAADLILEIAYNLSCYVYYDQNGRLVFRPYEEDYLKYPVFSLNNNDFNLLGITKEISLDQIYNSVQVIADNVQSSDIPIVAEVINRDLSDPNSFPNYGILKTYVVTDFTKGIDSTDLATARARWELKKVKSKQSNINANVMALYHVDVNDVVDVTDLSTGDSKDKYLVTSISLPIGTNSESTMRLLKANTDEDIGEVVEVIV